jgi:hypothetical protein
MFKAMGISKVGMRCEPKLSKVRIGIVTILAPAPSSPPCHPLLFPLHLTVKCSAFVLAHMLGLACPCLPVRGCVLPYLQMTLASPIV